MFGIHRISGAHKLQRKHIHRIGIRLEHTADFSHIQLYINVFCHIGRTEIQFLRTDGVKV